MLRPRTASQKKEGHVLHRGMSAADVLAKRVLLSLGEECMSVCMCNRRAFSPVLSQVRGPINGKGSFVFAFCPRTPTSSDSLPTSFSSAMRHKTWWQRWDHGRNTPWNLMQEEPITHTPTYTPTYTTTDARRNACPPNCTGGRSSPQVREN